MKSCNSTHRLEDGRVVCCSLPAGHDKPQLREWDYQPEHFARASVTWQDEPVASLFGAASEAGRVYLMPATDVDCDTATATTEDETGCPGLPCITQDPKEPVGPEFLAVCRKFADFIGRSRHCPPECGGHPICRPCWELAQRSDLSASSRRVR